MATSAFRIYNEAKKYLLTADLDINAATMRVGLFNSGVSDYTLSTWASLMTAGNPVSGGGYAVKTLTGITVTAGAAANTKQVVSRRPGDPVGRGGRCCEP